MSFSQYFPINNPSKVFRSKLFSIPSTAAFFCNTDFSQNYVWTLTQLDETTLKPTASVSLASNPTSTSPELVIKENTLDYGLYLFDLKVTVKYNTNSFKSANSSTYIKIIPTGLAVFAIENGVSTVLIGSNQAFNLQPTVYSFDMDNLIKADKLSFVYYCRTANQSGSNNVLNSQTDLKSFKSNANLVMDRNQNCFGSSSKKNFILYVWIRKPK